MTTSGLQPLAQGATLARGKYTIETVLGHGGFGYVYLARDQQGQAVAIKQCIDLSSEGLMQFGHEVAVQKIVDDATFVRVFAQFVEKVTQAPPQTATESLFTVMEYVPGRSLEELLTERLQQNQGPFAEHDAVSWIDQLLGALHHAHEVGVIHRDIKPANILLLPDGKRVKVIDFGIAKIGGAGTQTLHGARGVSPGYSPPEQYAQSGQTDTFSDIYAVGATLYRLLTGHAPVDAPVRQSGQTVTRPRQYNPSLSPMVERVILQALQLDVADRFQSAVEMQAALQGKPLVDPVRVTTTARFSVTPAQIDWGKVTFRQPPMRHLCVANEGTGRLQVSLHSPVSWLQITPSLVTVGPQEQQQVAVELLPFLVDARGHHREAIQLTAGRIEPKHVHVTVNLSGPAALSAAPRNRLSSLSDLMSWCDRHWHDAIRMLRSGELMAAIYYLGKPTRGSFAQKNAELPGIVLDKIQQASALPNDNLALETVLRVLGAKPPRFTHNWRAIERKLGMGWRPDLRWWWPWWSGPGPLTFVIQNRGRGYLYGRVDPAVAWLEVKQPDFGCLAGQKQRIQIGLKDQQRRLRGLAPQILILQVY